MTRQKDDWYPTPHKAIRSLLDVESFDETIWEPAAGDGAISKVLEKACYQVISSDLNDYGYCDAGVDFLMAHKKAADSLVTNPPYKLADQFIQHAINLNVNKHAWLLRMSFVEGQARFNDIYSHSPPAQIHVFSKRLTIWRGDQKPHSTGTTCYAWFVWNSNYNGKTQLGWL